MRRMYLFAALALIFGVLIFGYSQSPRRTSQTPQTVPTAESINPEKVLSTQQRINRYFHGDVMTKVTKCWANVQGNGTIAFKYTYTKAGTRWLFNKLETEQSTLPKGQDSLASKCMLNAVGASSFPVDTSEKSGNTFVLNWKWPVPFPANSDELTKSMFAMRVSKS